MVRVGSGVKTSAWMKKKKAEKEREKEVTKFFDSIRDALIVNTCRTLDKRLGQGHDMNAMYRWTRLMQKEVINEMKKLPMDETDVRRKSWTDELREAMKAAVERLANHVQERLNNKD